MSMRSGKRAVYFFAIATAVCLVAGCTTAGRRQSIQVQMTPRGECVLNGAIVAPERIGRALRAAGAGPSTRIDVTLPPHATTATLQDFARTLSQAGFRLVHFRTPKKAVSYTE